MLNYTTLLLCLMLAWTVSSTNVETRIHYMLKPAGGSDHAAFGTSIVIAGNPSKIFVGSPKKGDNTGGMYKCSSTFNQMSNQTSTCSSFLSVGSVNSSAGLSMGRWKSGSKDFVLVCGNQYTFSCPDLKIQQRMIGECYSFSAITESKATLPSPCPIGCPLGLVADIVFLMDSSGSVGTADFRTCLEWAADVLKKFSYDIDQRNVQVGYVRFAADTFKVGLKSTTYYALKDEFEAISYSSNDGSTDTARAIENGREIHRASTRSGIAKVMIVITDGRSNDATDTKNQALYARGEGITMISVGVGGNLDTEELQMIATGIRHDNTRVMTVANYNQLDTILDQLSQVIKETASTSLEGSTSNSTTELTQCQIGTSIHASASSLHIGATGAYDRTGTVAEYNNLDNFPKSVSSDHLNGTELEKILGLTNSSQLKESYFGYSVSSGQLTTGNEWIAMSAPRYLSRGMVLIYKEGAPESHTALHPSEDSGNWQLGAYYGHSVLVMDINNDGFDDLLVSSPLFSKTAGYDEGIVFVYMNNPASPGPSRWMSAGYSPTILEGGSVVSGRFGMSVVNGGDIDKNSYDDIIVGAPAEKYSDNGESGTIYIYFSSSSGVSTSQVQKIIGRTVSKRTQSLAGFGTAIYGGIDFDANGYPDVAVTAPSSDRVILLRSRKLISVTLTISVNPTSLNVINCVSSPTTRCSRVNICVSAVHVINPIPLETFAMDFNVTLDSLIGDSSRRRFQFLDTLTNVRSETGVSVGSTLVCRNYDMNFRLRSLGQLNGGGLETVPRVQLSVDFSASHKNRLMSGVLSPHISSSQTTDWTFQTGCSGTNGKCVHNLGISATYSENASPTPILLTGVSKKFVVNVDIDNKGPDHAYFLKINITSGNLTLLKVNGSCVQLSEEESDSSIGLTVIKYKSSSAALPDLMLTNDKCNFTIEFDFARLQSTANEENFHVKGVIYSNAGGETVAFDNNLLNNKFQFRRSLQYKSVVVMDGFSAPEKIFFNSSVNVSVINSLEDNVLGGNKTNLVTTFSLYNNGPLGLANSQVKFSWPEMTNTGFLIFYLVDIKCEPESACSCSLNGKANKFNLAPKKTSIGSYATDLPISYPTSAQGLNSTVPVTCQNSRCNEAICSLNYLPTFQKVFLHAHLKPWVPTFAKHFIETQISTSLELLPSNITPTFDGTKKQVATTLSHYDPTIPPPEPTSNAPNYGAIIGGIIAGLLLLLIVILVMWKTGFFKSKYANRTRAARQSIREASGPGAPTDAGADVPTTSDPGLNKSTEVLCD